MGEVKWVKLTTDMFDNRKIKYLRKLPDGNNIVLIWVMLLTMAGRCNAGGMIFLTENIAYTPKILADELGFEENTIVLALNALSGLGMIVNDENGLAISGWAEHQNIDGMERIKEQNRLRKQKQRENQKLLAEESRDSHVTVTECHATDIEEEREEDTTLKSSKGKRFTPPTLDEVTAYCKERGNSVDPQHFIDYYEARGWKIGSNPMKSWQAAVRTWEQREKPKSSPMTRQSAQASDLERMKAYL